MESFQRVEKKYLLSESQYQQLLDKINDHISKDRYYESDIQSIYYDTDNYELITRSIEKPEYKEKLRIRSYGEADDKQLVYVELKKKLNGIVYKRRSKAECKELLNNIYECEFTDKQVGREIKYALNYYKNLKPAIYIGCKRNSYVANDDRELRITFDNDVRYRTDHLMLRKDEDDKPVTDKIIMEIKIKQAMPLWLSKALDEIKAYPQGFSKVGTAFVKELKENLENE